jgi:hypothetical protein
MAEFEIPTIVKFKLSEKPVQEDIDAAVAAHMEAMKPQLVALATKTTQAFVTSHMNAMVQKEMERLVHSVVHAEFLPVIKRQVKAAVNEEMKRQAEAAAKQAQKDSGAADEA